MAKQRLLVAPKREFRDAVSPNWANLVRQTKGVLVLGENDRRVQIEAEDDSLATLRNALGERFHFEPLISHDKY